MQGTGHGEPESGKVHLEKSSEPDAAAAPRATIEVPLQAPLQEGLPTVKGSKELTTPKNATAASAEDVVLSQQAESNIFESPPKHTGDTHSQNMLSGARQVSEVFAAQLQSLTCKASVSCRLQISVPSCRNSDLRNTTCVPAVWG